MTRSKIITTQKAASMIKDGMTVMVGGFMTNGTTEAIIDEMVSSNIKNLTIICNDAGLPGKGVGKLLENGQISKLIATHVGLNPECGKQFSNGKLDLELIPQGTFAEQIRCGGAGLGGFLTPTGLGTIVEEGKMQVTVKGKTFLLEEPLRADVALIKGHMVDEGGNVRYRGSTRNFNVMMATAADVVIVEADKIVEKGAIGTEYVETPHIFVDYIVGGVKG